MAKLDLCYGVVMRIAPYVFLIAVLVVQAAPAARAAPDAGAVNSNVLPVVDAAGRKGTRNYTGDATTATQSDATETKPAVTAEALEQCMATWDTGTHITKAKWREICKRQLEDRDAR
jgi:hypothetical protein